MLKKILLLTMLSPLIISCDDLFQTEKKSSVKPATPESRTKKPTLKSFPSVSLTNKKVVQSVGFSHGPGKIIITNSFTGEQVESCGKTNISKEGKEYSKTSEDISKCKVEILNVKENQKFINLLEQINSFKQPVLIKRKGEIQKVTANFLMMANYTGSCGSLTNSGGDQVESEVDCFSSEALLCQGWVDNGWDFVKDYPPCKQYYD